ncbi:flavin monoamine oxidase family protein [Neolewinella agarilytica]|uniref:Monoamine oxidase n=1 Tax=Neolewinella agarilytica TaxID=478744 RepID=A0A1H9ASJ4_9BACT|nr:NAD(P)/FAD-dependent oxidoreductase [Neolewinella agarilytica]SEP79744.1 monoamine oxidase [Neolewinella agarilytica]
MEKTETLIIGAGLAGLTAAYELHKAGKPFLLLEARDRIGGRILTSRVKGESPLELGATWFGKKHTALVSLLEELKIPSFEQVTGGRAIYEAISTSPAQVVQLPHNDEPSYRIAGGSDTLVRKLAELSLSEESFHLKETVKSITLKEEKLLVTTDQGRYLANRVISTLPPYLLANSIEITPALPDAFVSIANSTHTWMGESIKVGLRYASPFWRADGGPGGTIFSNVGPVSEMYDHTNVEDNHYALKGFLNGAYHSLTREERCDLVLNQLRKYYGDVVDSYTSYEEAVWRHESHTFLPYEEHLLPHQHNGHPIFRKAYLDGRLLLAGAETAVLYPGYMDGAVRSGQRVAAL